MKMPTMNKPARRRPRSEDVAYVKHSVAKATGLKVSLDRLDADEVYELKALVDAIRASADEGTERSNPSALDDVAKLKRYEALAAKAAGESSDFFDRERERVAAAAAEAERKRKPSAHPLLVEPGTVQLPSMIFEGLQSGDWNITHALVTMLVLGALQNRAPLHRFMRIENDSLVAPSAEHLVAPLDLDGNVCGVASALRELADGGVLVVKRRGELSISLGDALKRSLS